MEIINIKNVQVRPNVGPPVSMRMLRNVSEADLDGLAAGDVVTGDSLKALLSSYGDTSALESKGTALESKVTALEAKVVELETMDQKLTTDMAFMRSQLNTLLPEE